MIPNLNITVVDGMFSKERHMGKYHDGDKDQDIFPIGPFSPLECCLESIVNVPNAEGSPLVLLKCIFMYLGILLKTVNHSNGEKENGHLVRFGWFPLEGMYSKEKK